MNFNCLPISMISIILVLLIPTTVVFGQTSPWGLFQQLCQTGRLATGPQCQGLFQGQQPSTTTGTTTAVGTCPTGFVIQNNLCVPTTSSTTGTTSTTTSQPIANAGPNQVVSQGSLVTLVGTGSSSNGGTVQSYLWVQTSGTPVSLNGANTATPTFTAPTEPTSLIFSLTVTDSTGAVSSPATVTISVS
jgi:PKD domain